jgi:hypothetical protein
MKRNLIRDKWLSLWPASAATLEPPKTVCNMKGIRIGIAMGMLIVMANSGRAQVAANDQFTNALVIKGQWTIDSDASFVGATTEPGEPPHLGGQPCKSLWWRWQAPMNAHATFSEQLSLATNITLAVYNGDSIDGLTPVGITNHSVTFFAVGGTTYSIAMVLPADATEGPVRLQLDCDFELPTTPSIPVPGNLLQEWSFENTYWSYTYWQVEGSIGRAINMYQGADGGTYPVLQPGSRLWQDFSTIPGQQYRLKFAFFGHGTVSWDDQQIGVLDDGIPPGLMFYWHWGDFQITASNTTSRVTFEDGIDPLSIDAVSVVALNEAPSFITQPSSLSIVAGGTATFSASAKGSPPLAYQWYFQSAPVAGATSDTLLLESVSAAQVGQYVLMVSNPFGSATSAPAALVLDAPVSPTIVLQPYGDTIALGGYFVLSVAAIGAPPLSYQWFLDGLPVTNATNCHLVLSSFSASDAGAYTVKVWNQTEAVWSLAANLRVAEPTPGGGVVLLANWFTHDLATNAAPVLDADGITAITGPDYVAQLYAGPELALLRPTGAPTPFTSPIGKGFFQEQTVVLPTVAPGSNAFLQIRVWQASKGASYEEARALGGKFGRSEVLQLIAGNEPGAPQVLVGLQSFSLQAGLPQFTAGRIDPGGIGPTGLLIWSLVGQAGCRYSIERSLGDFVWRPWLVLTNLTGTVTFDDPTPLPVPNAFYRARILD